MRQTLSTYGLTDSEIADLAIQQEQAIEERKVRDWETNLDVQNQMKRSLDNIYYTVEERRDVLFAAEHLDQMIDQVIEVAKARSDGRSSD